MSKEVQQMFGSIASRYDLANDVLSLGVHRLWRRTLAKMANLQPNQSALDLCAGTGDVAFQLAKHLRGSGKIYAVDFVHPMLRIANNKKRKLFNDMLPVYFLQADALHIPLPDSSVAVATVAFGIRNVDSPAACLREMARVVKPGGQILVMEFGQPKWPVFSQFYDWYSRNLMPRIGGYLTGDRAAYEYLPRTAKAFPAGDAFLKLMHEAGLQKCKAHPLIGGLAYVYSAENNKNSAAPALLREAPDFRTPA